LQHRSELVRKELGHIHHLKEEEKKKKKEIERDVRKEAQSSSTSNGVERL
jgi:hypothetical protein